MTTLTPVYHQTLTESVAKALRQAIRDGLYEPGHHLVERRVATELGASSIAVREAFARLDEEGLVVRRPRLGTFVASLSPEALRDLTRVRVALEQLVVELAARNWARDAQGKLQAIVDAMEVAAERGDSTQLFNLDTTFHEKFWQLAGSETLLDLAGNLRGRVSRFLRQATLSLDAEELRLIPAIHQDWLDAVAARDVPRAQIEVARHITAACERVISRGLTRNADA